jgi:MoxR-like ATPase
VTSHGDSSIESLVPDTAVLTKRLDEAGYLTDLGLATALFCAVRLPQPLLLEGEAGVGKTEAAKTLAAVLDTPLIRLQCFEGITASEALYEWNYQRQLLAIRVAEAGGGGAGRSEDSLFTAEYLVERPLLRALRHSGPRPAVLLIDEVDRADDEFEAFLFEMLAESTVTIPELGTVRASHPPIVILTSNRTRDLHDALKRRCLYHWIDYPPVARATAIIRHRVPAARSALAEQVSGAVSRLRSLDVQKPPGIAEAIGWVSALQVLGIETLTPDTAELTLGSILKYREDVNAAQQRGLDWVVAGGPEHNRSGGSSGERSESEGPERNPPGAANA